MTAETAAPAAPATAARATPRQLLTQTTAIAWRHLLHLPRNPQLLVFMVVQPIIFTLLFAYVFGGAIEVPGAS